LYVNVDAAWVHVRPFGHCVTVSVIVAVGFVAVDAGSVNDVLLDAAWLFSVTSTWLLYCVPSGPGANEMLNAKHCVAPFEMVVAAIVCGVPPGETVSTIVGVPAAPVLFVMQMPLASPFPEIVALVEAMLRVAVIV
jgi:hypothetical protein